MFSSDSVSHLTPIHVLIGFSFTPNSCPCSRQIQFHTYPCSHQIQFHSKLLSMFSSDSVSLLTPIHVLIRFSFTPNSYPYSVSHLTPIHVLIGFSFTPNSCPCSRQIQFHTYPCSHQIQFHSKLLSMFPSDSVSHLTPIHVLIGFSFTPNSCPCSHQIQFHS
ncbi:hypothetical protein BgiBS90_028052 [Biomphalaria glabrata]|nr:hypothetical protein BgiBS90_028052 [Biomphalaria glabrata]